jgi:hypothetical protein
MSTKIRIEIELDIDVSDELYGRMVNFQELGSVVLDNCFRNNPRTLQKVTAKDGTRVLVSVDYNTIYG